MKVAIPIETKSRELDGKLWLALHLVERGHDVVLGHHPVVTDWLDRLQPDVYLSVSGGGPPEKLTRFRHLQENGVSVMILDNEGGVFKNDSVLLVRLAPELLDHTDRYFAWGERPAEIVHEETGFPEERLTITGPPKIDLLQEDYREYYARRADQLTERYGDFVLVATSFGLANHYDDQLQTSMYTSDDILRLRKPENQLEHRPIQRKIFEGFLKAIPKLADKLDDLTFVIRPHPSEDRSTYEDRFADISNIVVNEKGPVHEWLLNATALIHNNSTTGVEGVLMDRPVIAFVPVTDNEYDSILPNYLSRTALDTESLISHLEKSRNHQGTIEELSSDQYDLLNSYIDNIETVAAEQIADVIDNATPADWDTPFEPSMKNRSKRFLKYRLPTLFEFVRNGKLLLEGRNNMDEYVEQKFPSIEASELESMLDLMMTLDDRFEHLDPTVRQTKDLPNVFLIGN